MKKIWNDLVLNVNFTLETLKFAKHSLKLSCFSSSKKKTLSRTITKLGRLLSYHDFDRIKAL